MELFLNGAVSAEFSEFSETDESLENELGRLLFSTNSTNSFKENYCLSTPPMLSRMKLAALETSLPRLGSLDPFNKALTVRYMCSIYLPCYVTHGRKLLLHQCRLYTGLF